MKAFVIRFFRFIFLFGLVLAGIFCLIFLKKHETYTIKKHNIIIGDSNTRWGINDSILNNYHNFSTGGETYIFAFTKLRMLEKDNKIDTLLLSFNPHNLINNEWWDDTKTTPLQNRMPFFYNSFSYADHLVLMKTTPKNYLQSFIKTEAIEIYRLLGLNREDKMFKFGSFIPVKNKKVNDTLFSHKKQAKVSDVEILYLKKIKEECKKNNIKLILVQPPKNKNSNRYVFYDFKEFYQIYHNDFADIDFLDFSKMDISEEYFWDIFHLNDAGADYFSNFLENKKIKNLLNSDYNRKRIK